MNDLVCLLSNISDTKDFYRYVKELDVVIDELIRQSQSCMQESDEQVLYS